MVAILLGTGFEEVEALAACDILRRANVKAQLVGIDGDEVTGAHGIRVKTDLVIERLRPQTLDMIVLPGGMGSVTAVLGSEAAQQAVRYCAEHDKYVAAICASPTTLAKLGLVEGKHAVCYPGMEDQMEGAVMHMDRQTVTDGKLITGRAPGAAIDFALELVRVLCGEETASAVADGLVYDGEI